MTHNHTFIIEAQEITKVFTMGEVEVPALNGTSIQVREGEFVAIMGPSGSGKSTLMSVLGCLMRPTSGRYLLGGEDVSDLNKVDLAFIRNKKIGFVFQTYNLLPRASALQNVMLPLFYDREDRLGVAEKERKAAALLEAVGLGDRLDHEPQELSGGEQQRVAIARALVNDPVVILADEPTGNLDSKSGAEIMNLLVSLHQQRVTIVMVTHDPATAAYSDRTIHLLDGKVKTEVHNAKEHA